MFHRLITTQFLAAVALLFLGAGCATEAPSPEDAANYPEGPLHPDTILLEELPGFESVSVSDDLSLIVATFVGSAADSGVAPGKIVAGILDGGYLRRVDSVSTNGNDLTLGTSHSTLEEAVTDVVISEEFTWGERTMLEFTGQTLYSSDEEGHRGSVTIDRGIVHIDPKFNLDLDLGFLSLKSATATIDMGVSQDIEVSYTAEEALTADGAVPLETLEFPLEARAGLLRFTGTLEVTVGLGFSHHAQGPMAATQSVDTSGRVLYGGTYTTAGDSWESIYTPEFAGQVSSDDYTGKDWQGRVWITVDSIIHFDKVEGSSGHLEPSLSGWAESDCEEVTWGASGRMTGGGVMELGFFSSGPRTEILPEIDIEADSTSRSRAHETPPLGCDDEPVDPPPGTDPLFPVGGCAPAAIVSCGDRISGDTAEGIPDTTSVFDGYSCSVGDYGASEITFAFEVDHDSEVTVEFEGATPTEVNHDIFVLESPPSSYTCAATSCLTMGFNAATFDAVAGSTYYLVIDGDTKSPGSFEASINCD